MNKNKKIVAASLLLGGLATMLSNQSKADCRDVATVTAEPQIVNIQEDIDDTKIINTASGFKKLTRVTAEPTAEPTKEPQGKLYKSIPFTARFQNWIDKQCKEYEISTNVVMGVIKKESNFTIKAMGDNGEAYGLMQIQKKWHTKRMKKVNAVDLLNCYDNVHTGIDYLAEMYFANGCNWHKALMAYNGGQAYADRRCRNGLYSSDYSRKVMSYAENYKKERNN